MVVELLLLVAVGAMLVLLFRQTRNWGFLALSASLIFWPAIIDPLLRRWLLRAIVRFYIEHQPAHGWQWTAGDVAAFGSYGISIVRDAVAVVCLILI